MKIDDLTSALAGRGLLPADASRPPLQNDRPWYIGLVLGTSGWLAGISAMAFIGMLFTPDSVGEFAVAAGILLGSAYGLYAVDRDSAFFDQLALALSIAGQVALLLAVVDLFDSEALTCGVMALLQAALVLAMPNRLARTVSALFACILWALTWRFGWWDTSFFGGRESQPAQLAPALLSWIAIWVPLMTFAWWLIQREAQWMATNRRKILRPVLTGVLIALTFGTFASEPFASFDLWPSGVTSRTNWLVLWPLLAVAASLFAGFCALLVRNNALVGAAITAALLHVMQFYFLLGTTLLVKSAIMLGVGVALFVAGNALRGRRAAAVEIAP